MIIKMNRIEMAVLVVHMSAMRKNVKRGFKSNYGKDEGKKILESYDEVKTAFQEAIEGLEEDNQEKEIHFNINEINMLNSFVSWYVLELEITFDATGQKTGKEDQAQIDTLKGIKEKIEKVIEEYAA